MSEETGFPEMSQEQQFSSPETNEQPFGISLLSGCGLSIGGLLVGALLWGVIAYFTESVFFAIPIGVGFAITAGLFLPFKRVPWYLALLLFFPSLILTVASVMLGDYVFYVLMAAKDNNVRKVIFASSSSVYGDTFVSAGTVMQASVRSLPSSVMSGLS